MTESYWHYSHCYSETRSPTNFAPISFSAWNSAHHRPGKVTAKKDPAENSSSRQKTAGAGRSQQEQAEASRSRQKPSEASKNQQQLPQRQQEQSSQTDAIKGK